MIAVDKRGGCLPTYNKVKRVVIQETGFPSSSTGKDSACQCRRPRFDLRVEKIPWRRAWKPTPRFLSGESPWTEEPGGLESMVSQRVRHDSATKHSTYRKQGRGRTGDYSRA